MKQNKSEIPRSRFVVWGLGVLASFTALRFFQNSAKKETGKKVKMLSQDGTLMEVDEELLKSARRKVTRDELQAWVKK